MAQDRREILKLLLAAGAAGGLNSPIGRALALPANRRTGTIQDVEHVVILMQENRSFDHYFGTMRGVRGFGDPRPMRLPGGNSVFEQPVVRGGGPAVLPFRLNVDGRHNNAMNGLDHLWKGPHDLWKDWDAWVERKSALCMGHHTREDLPFYYALADAFTLCDGYHISLFGPTNPNRMYLFTATSGLAVGDAGLQVARNVDDHNWTGDASRDDPKFQGHGWTTYAERLQKAGISWRVYQEYDNFGDNSLAYFANFRGLDPSSELYRRARAIVPGSTQENAEASEGEHLAAALRHDVENDTLPQVSWIVGTRKTTEHPGVRGLEWGQHLVSQILASLTANPKVWAKTAFFITYDENDGFFDHVPPPLPAITPELGKSTVSTAGETYNAIPVGLGPRVPMFVISPWSKGGWVNSQVFDHTSVIRFLEKRFGVMEPNITPWRRAVTGDLSSAFDFAHADGSVPAWPDTANSRDIVEQSRLMRRPRPMVPASLPRQEPGRRPARPLPYRFEVIGTVDATAGMLKLKIVNSGAAGAGFNLYSMREGQDPRFYTVEAGKSLEDMIPLGSGEAYWFRVHGPNGFLREFKGRPGAGPSLAVVATLAPDGALLVEVRNDGTARCSVELAPLDYLPPVPRSMSLRAGQSASTRLAIASADHWYDLAVKSPEDSEFLVRLAGHAETGRPSKSDPAIGRTEYI
jgi:phospholipase C